jgi:hypothetical protein
MESQIGLDFARRENSIKWELVLQKDQFSFRHPKVTDCTMVASTSTLYFLIVLATASARVPDNLEEILKANRALTPIGSVGGKTFFLEPVTRSWSAALTYCKTLNMELASIQSLEENNFLKNNTFLTSSTYYWTSGRDAGTRDQYLWNTGGGKLGNFGNTFAPASQYSCLLFRAGASYGTWAGTSCSSTSYGLICQNV